MNGWYDGGERRAQLMEIGLLSKVAYRKDICIWTLCEFKALYGRF